MEPDDALSKPTADDGTDELKDPVRDIDPNEAITSSKGVGRVEGAADRGGYRERFDSSDDSSRTTPSSRLGDDLPRPSRLGGGGIEPSSTTTKNSEPLDREMQDLLNEVKQPAPRLNDESGRPQLPSNINSGAGETRGSERGTEFDDDDGVGGDEPLSSRSRAETPAAPGLRGAADRVDSSSGSGGEVGGRRQWTALPTSSDDDEPEWT